MLRRRWIRAQQLVIELTNLLTCWNPPPRRSSARRRIWKIEKSFSSISPIAETVHSTAFYVLSARALVASDLIFSRYHLNILDTNNPDSWIRAIELARGMGPIDAVFPATASSVEWKFVRKQSTG